MSSTININIKKLPSGKYKATSNDFEELIVIENNIAEALRAAKEKIHDLLRA
ncbi:MULTISPECIES: hypothetical protein [unclassified Lentimicrobium]|uniref:hypothetical protein n=1 Tax=unclassified Lentimicrobium TaxID=2677434 RepID=UPI0015532829|nr:MULTISPECIES: hypothetical protein [unclassified Lentimicrobium]NPD44225.1 hypothetical protein [Lentimicrobium sp. S6]NPD85763.1 hypothetical protein [Lentimicrobium sp. L6]